MQCRYRSQSQWQDDLRLLPLLACTVDTPPSNATAAGRHSMRPGSFVELGAFDGVHNSNSYLLEKCHGWKGLLVEASPTNYLKLASSERAVETSFSSTAMCSGVQPSQIERCPGDSLPCPW